MGRKHYQPKTRRRGSDTWPPKRNARLSRDTGGRCAFRRSSCLSYGREHPVSRVLSWVAIYLKSALRRSLRDRTRGSAGSLVPSYSVLLRTGFAWRGNRFPPGGLLPHLFTLALEGRYVSVALSFGLHQLGITQRPALRSPDFPPSKKESGHQGYSLIKIIPPSPGIGYNRARPGHDGHHGAKEPVGNDREDHL